MTGHRGFILQATYRIHHGVPVVYLFGRLETGETFTIRDNRQRPHFYVTRDALARAPDLQVAPSNRSTLAGQPVYRVEVAIPADAPPLRDRLHELGVSTYEADVRFAMRYLIDRGIRSGVEIIPDTAPTAGTGTDWLFENPELRPAEVIAAPRVLSFDIETDPQASRLYAIALYGLGIDEVVVVDPEHRDMPDGAIGVETEKDALHYFAERVAELDVDILTGWNVIDFDLTVLEKVAQRVRYELSLGREKGRMRLRPAEGYFGSGSATIPGRLVLDGLDLVRGAFIRLDDYSLDAVARAYLGEGKTLGEGQLSEIGDKVEQILYTYRRDLPRFCEYARTDARLVLRILDVLQLIPLAFARARLTGMTADRVAASIASFDFVYLAALARRKLVAPSVAQPGNTARVSQGGGAVFEPEVGIHSNVWVFDFKSLYPSIIRTFNIDPVEYARAQPDNCIRTEDGAEFSRQWGILPSLLDTLFDERARARAAGDDVASQAIKILMNSFYGVLGTPACRFYNPAIANAITSQGRYFLNWSRDWFNARGFRVLYGDTDSVFVLSLMQDVQEAARTGVELVTEFNVELHRFIQARYSVDSRLELEFEKLYTDLFLARTRSGSQGARKRYAGIRHGATSVEFVGMEVVRRDWTELAKMVQRNLFTRLFQGDEVAEFLAGVVRRLRAGELNDLLVYRKGLRKDVESYRTNVPPHVQAVKKSSATPPRVVSYVMTEQGPELAAEQVHRFDIEHYVERQIRPVAEPVLDVLGLEFAKVIGDDRQISLF